MGYAMKRKRSASTDVIDITIELRNAEEALLERLQRLPLQKISILPWSIRQALGRVKRLRAKAEATPGWPAF